MRYALAVLVCLAATPALFAQQDVGIDRDSLLAMTRDLQEAGQRWLDGEGVDPDLQRRLKGVWYDAESLPTLADVLQPATDEQEQIDEAIQLYVVTRLFQPMLLARQDVLRQALSIVREQYERLGNYEDLPHWTDGELGATARPRRQSGENNQDYMRRRDEARALRQEMAAEQRRVQLHNGAVKQLRRQYVRLLLRADEPQADDEVFRMLADAAANGQLDFVDILGQIRSAAADMSRQHAAAYYNRLKEMWTPESMAGQTFVDMGDVATSDRANPSFATQTESPGELLLQTINILAASARLPALAAP